MQVQSLGWEDPLEEGIPTHSSIPAWRIPWTEEPGGLSDSLGLWMPWGGTLGARAVCQEQFSLGINAFSQVLSG